MKYSIQRLLTFGALFLSSCLTPGFGHAASMAPVAAKNGMVVTAQHLATQVGVDVLRKGGNAVDAAVAVGYALAVVYPAAGNIGGGGFMLVQTADGKKDFIDFRETAPLAATKDMYLDKDGNVVPRLSSRGHLAVGVPGTVAGLEMAREVYGTKPRAELLAPAIRLAKKGMMLEQGDVTVLESATQDFIDDPASAAIFLKNGVLPYAVGDRLVQKDLAATLKGISDKGVDGFYKGKVAKAIVASSKAGKGILTLADLETYRPVRRAPLEIDYRGYTILSSPPPSSGGVTIGQILNILEAFPLAEWGYGSAKGVHVQIEAMRHAYIDRNTYLGDPAFVDNPTQRLLSKAYAGTIRNTIQMDKAGVSDEIKPGVPPHEGSNTTHYSVVDQWGNAVAVTYTLNDWFGARVTAGGTGVLLNDEMDDFTAKPGIPNIYGLIQGEANAIAPGKRPLSSMSPTIVSKDGKPMLILGTPGGSRIITATLLTILNVIDYGMDVQEAVDAPRFHHQWQPDVTNLERFALSPDTRRTLESMGHKFGPPHPANHIAAILIGAPALDANPIGDNTFYGANDPRKRTGLAQGF